MLPWRMDSFMPTALAPAATAHTKSSPRSHRTSGMGAGGEEESKQRLEQAGRKLRAAAALRNLTALNKWEMVISGLTRRHNSSIPSRRSHISRSNGRKIPFSNAIDNVRRGNGLSPPVDHGRQHAPARSVTSLEQTPETGRLITPSH